MKHSINCSVDYDRPLVNILEIETTSVLCASSDQLSDIKKEDFEFGWE